MNKNTGIVVGIIALAALVVIIVVIVVNNHSTPATNVIVTPSATTSTTQTTAPAAQPSTPVAMTNATASPTDTTAIVTGTVSPNGALTQYWFEYGTSSNLGNATSKQSIGSGYTVTSAPGYITGLVKDTTYYFRLDAQNQYGQVTGATYSFQTT
jgi:hypothetical protein